MPVQKSWLHVGLGGHLANLGAPGRQLEGPRGGRSQFLKDFGVPFWGVLKLVFGVFWLYVFGCLLKVC